MREASISWRIYSDTKPLEKHPSGEPLRNAWDIVTVAMQMQWAV